MRGSESPSFQAGFRENPELEEGIGHINRTETNAVGMARGRLGKAMAEGVAEAE